MCDDCVLCFSEDPLGTFPPGVFSFLKIPLPLSYPRGDCFPQKTYIPPRGVLRGYYDIYTAAVVVTGLYAKDKKKTQAAE